MNPGILTALLIAGLLVPMTTAAAGPVETVEAVVLCVLSAVHTDGGVSADPPYQTFVNLHEPCLN